MPTKRELEQEIKRLRAQLKKNEELLMQAAIKAEELQGIQIGVAQTREKITETRARRPSPG